MPFLQTEYVSAAFCFIILFISFSVPPLLFFKLLGKNVFAHGISNYHKWDNAWAQLLFIWYFLLGQVIKVFLPDSSISPLGKHFELATLIVFGVHLVVGICAFIIGGYWRKFVNGEKAVLTEKNIKFRNTKFMKAGNVISYWPIYIIILIFITLFFNTRIDKAFCTVTIIYWFIWDYIPGLDVKHSWKTNTDLLSRTIIALGLFLAFIVYIQLFAVNQFSQIPQVVGGGKPEVTFLNISGGHHEAVQSMGIPALSSNGNDTNRFGPVSILLRTDNFLLVLNNHDTTSPITNASNVIQIRSDLVSGITFLKGGDTYSFPVNANK